MAKTMPRSSDEADLAILRMFATGMTDTEIAKRLGRSRNAVISVRARIRVADVAESGEPERQVLAMYRRGVAGWVA